MLDFLGRELGDFRFDLHETHGRRVAVVREIGNELQPRDEQLALEDEFFGQARVDL